jgi:Tol biopolymer transport system component
MKTRLKAWFAGVAALAAAAAIAVSLLPGPAVAETPVTPGVLTQLTVGECCTRPFWSSDSRQVLFIDKPASDAQVGIYGVDVAQPRVARLVTPRIALYTHGMALVIDLKPNSTTLERTSDGSRWTVPAGGAPVTVSPNEKRIAWTRGNEGPGAPETRGARIQVANFDGTGEKTVATVRGGSIAGWIADDALLISSRSSPSSREHVLYALSVVTGGLTELARSENLRGQSLSRDGSWVAYHVAPEPDADKNGLWVVRTDGSTRFRVPPELFGAYQWRDGQRLLIIPFRPAAQEHELWEMDAATQQAHRLTDSQVTPFKVNDGDWVVSPDGHNVAFVSARDRNVWLLSLPD